MFKLDSTSTLCKLSQLRP